MSDKHRRCPTCQTPADEVSQDYWDGYDTGRSEIPIEDRNYWRRRFAEKVIGTLVHAAFFNANDYDAEGKGWDAIAADAFLIAESMLQEAIKREGESNDRMEHAAGVQRE